MFMFGINIGVPAILIFSILWTCVTGFFIYILGVPVMLMFYDWDAIKEEIVPIPLYPFLMTCKERIGFVQGVGAVLLFGKNCYLFF